MTKSCQDWCTIQCIEDNMNWQVSMHERNEKHISCSQLKTRSARKRGILCVWIIHKLCVYATKRPTTPSSFKVHIIHSSTWLHHKRITKTIKQISNIWYIFKNPYLDLLGWHHQIIPHHVLRPFQSSNAPKEG